MYFDANALIGIIFPDQKTYEAMDARTKVLVSSGKLKEALTLCKKIAGAYPEHQQTVYHKAVDIAYTLKDYSAVIDFANLILEVTLEDPVIFLRAVADEEIGELEQARQDYLTFINYSSHSEKQDSLAEAYYRVGRLGMILNLDSSEITPYFLLLFEKNLQHPLCPAAGYWLVSLYLQEHDITRADAIADILFSRYPEDLFREQAELKIARYEADMGNLEKAEKLLDSLSKSKNSEI